MPNEVDIMHSNKMHMQFKSWTASNETFFRLFFGSNRKFFQIKVDQSRFCSCSINRSKFVRHSLFVTENHNCPTRIRCFLLESHFLGV